MYSPVSQKEEIILEELKGLLIEGEFNIRWDLIKLYHKAGKIILENNLDPQRVAEYLNRSERTIEYIVKFARNFEKVDDLPDGKNVSWRGIIKEHLTESKEKKECEHEPISICSICKVRLEFTN